MAKKAVASLQKGEGRGHAKVVKMPLTHKPCTLNWRNNQQPLPTLADVGLLMQQQVCGQTPPRAISLSAVE